MAEATSRTAVITGGVSGLGLATAARLREDGIRVITIDLAGDADYQVDVSDSAQVSAVAESIGPVDILVNCAGAARAGVPLWETTDDEWKLMFDVNVAGTFYCCRAFIPGMIAKGWGRVVNIASMAGKEGNALNSAYSASKAAVIGLTKSLGKELATTGVLANAVAPGVFDTPMVAATNPEVVQTVIDKIPMGRTGRPEEAAELIAFLVSDRLSFSTGFTYDLSGGRATY